MQRWYIKFPGNPYAYGPIEAANESAARSWAREWLGLDRLPKGFACWPA